MPELPEVETVLRGVAPHLRGKTVQRAVVRERRLRWRVPDGLERILRGQRIRDLTRRAKYLLFHMDDGCLMLHLGHVRFLARAADAASRGDPWITFDLILRDGPVPAAARSQEIRLHPLGHGRAGGAPLIAAVLVRNRWTRIFPPPTCMGFRASGTSASRTC